MVKKEQISGFLITILFLHHLPKMELASGIVK